MHPTTLPDQAMYMGKFVFIPELADYEKNVNRQIKHHAYRKAASALAAHPVQISSVAEAKKLVISYMSYYKKKNEIYYLLCLHLVSSV